MAISIGNYCLRDTKPIKGLLTAEWIAMGYLLLTLLMMAIMWPKLVHPESMLWGRFFFVVSTVAAWGVYRLFPCRLALLARVVLQMAFLSWWYPDTYELNRTLPNLDHLLHPANRSSSAVSPHCCSHNISHGDGFPN